MAIIACLGTSAGVHAQPGSSSVPPRPGSSPKKAASPPKLQAAASGARSTTPPAPAARPHNNAAAPAASFPSKPAPGTKKADEPPPAQVKKARDLWYKGVDAFRNGNYDAARLAFAECYQLMPKSDVLRNLSISEIQSGHYVSAARHLSLLLAAPGELEGNVREEATHRLAQAEAQIGQLSINVDVTGAEIGVDGAVIGRSPLEGNWYIEPGQHEITVSKPGYPVESRQVFALAGVAIPVNVALEVLRREQASDEAAARLMGTSEGEAPVPVDRGNELSTGSTVLLVTTGTIAVASLAAGIIFTASANGHDSDAEGLSERFRGASACYPGTPFREDCALVKRQRDDAHSDRQRALVGFVGFGVASAATLGYALWLALDGNDTKSTSTAMGVEPAVTIGPTGASLSLQAQF
jgi:PEGA domain-containing protein